MYKTAPYMESARESALSSRHGVIDSIKRAEDSSAKGEVTRMHMVCIRCY